MEDFAMLDQTWEFIPDDESLPCIYTHPEKLTGTFLSDFDCIRELYRNHASNTLNRDCSKMTNEYLTAWSSMNRVMIIRCQSHAVRGIVATVTLGLSLKLKGSCAVIEDVITHKDHRRRGLAEKIMIAQLEFADRQGFEYIDLTNRTSRGNSGLYTKLGFALRETDVYRRMRQ